MVLIAEAKFVALTKIHIQPEKFSLASNAALDTVQKYHAAIKIVSLLIKILHWRCVNNHIRHCLNPQSILFENS